MNNLLSYCGLVDTRISASEDLPVTRLAFQSVEWFRSGQDNKNSNFHNFLPNLHNKRRAFKSETPLSLNIFYFRMILRTNHGGLVLFFIACLTWIAHTEVIGKQIFLHFKVQNI